MLNSSLCLSAWRLMCMVPVYLATDTPVHMCTHTPVLPSTNIWVHAISHGPLASTHAPAHTHPPSSLVNVTSTKLLTQPHPRPQSHSCRCPLVCPCSSHEHTMRPQHLLMGLTVGRQHGGHPGDTQDSHACGPTVSWRFVESIFFLIAWSTPGCKEK